MQNLKATYYLLQMGARVVVSAIEYRIRLKRGDFEVEVQGDKEWVEAKYKELTSEKSLSQALKSTEIGTMPQTIGEFLDEKGDPTKHTDATAVFAYWLFKVEKMQSFNVQDILTCFDKTRKAKPSNVNQIINQNVAMHIFAEASEKKDGLKAWVITRKGEEYVEQMNK
jgi:hypothetical protein